MPAFADLTGRRFGKLIAVKFIRGSRARKSKWSCICDCGRTTDVITSNLTLGRTLSCGCWLHEFPRANATHKRSFTAEHNIWRGIKQRCLNKNRRVFKYYGGRGIEICKRWSDSCQAFLEDMGERPSPQHTIERKNNDGNYEPENCVWATMSKQGNNKRSNRMLEHDGQRMTVAQWARKTGLPPYVISIRINTLGWSVHDALTMPRQKSRWWRRQITVAKMP